MTLENQKPNQSKLSREIWCTHEFSSGLKIDKKLAQQLKDELGQDADKFLTTGTSISQILVKYGHPERNNRTIASVHKDIAYSNNNPEPWALRWVAAPIGYLCSKGQREEWLGDLYEVIHEMQTKSYPRWTIDLICIGKTTILIFSAFEIKITDFFTLLKKS